MMTFRTALISAALAACWSTGALAQATTNSSGVVTSGYGSSGMKHPCDDDYIKFCPGVSRYGMRQCILDHQPDLSSACKAERKAEAVVRSTNGS